MIKANLFEMGIVLLMVGCLEASALFEPADLNDPITLEKIIAEATYAKSLQKRGEKGKELYYSPDEQTLYTGWGKEMHDNGRIKSLIQVKEGKMSGIINVWYENGQKKVEGNGKEGKVISAATWKPNGEKCPLTNLKEGNGVSVAYYESGQMMMKENYKDGNRNGSYVRWNENGRKSIEGNYKNGKMHGFVTKWYENGKKMSEENYKDGKPDGLIRGWHENGQEKGEGRMKEGKQDGVWIRRHPNGQKQDEGNYKDGKPDGLYTTWYENGQKKEEGNYKNGKIDGLWTKWFGNGQKEWVQTWKKDKKDGLSADWYENGRKRSEENFRKGKLRSAVVRKPNGEKCPVTNVKEGSGVMVEYNEDGTERFRLIFKDGERVEQELEDLLKNPFPLASPI